MITRRRFLAATAATALTEAALAQPHPYPTRPVRWVVGYPPGGGTDFLARTVAAQLSAQLGQQFFVDNKPGAAGIIAAESVARAPADGYTLFTGDNGILVYNSALYKRLPYSPERDFTPIGLMTRAHLALVATPGFAFRDVRSLLEDMRKRPGAHSYASPGAGTPHHLAMEWFKSEAKVQVAHVPYRGGAAALQDVMGGQVPLMLLDMPSGFSAGAAGKVVPLLSFSSRRIPLLKNAPTAAEIGLPLETYAWQGVVAPAGLPADIQGRLAAELQKALGDPAVQKKLTDAGLDTTPGDPAQMARYVADEKARWHRIIQSHGLQLE